MKWVTHIIWAGLAYKAAGLDPATALALAGIATAITDVLGHRGLRRAWWHDPLAVAAHIAVYPGGGLWSLLAGLSHVALDWISPGRLAVSWVYNFPFMALGAWLWTLQLSI